MNSVTENEVSYVFIDTSSDGRISTTVYTKVMSDCIGCFAERLLFAYVTSGLFPKHDAGRADIINHCLDLAKDFYEISRERGHLLDLPDLRVLKADTDKETNDRLDRLWENVRKAAEKSKAVNNTPTES